MSDRDGGITYDAGKLTVGEYLDGWLKDSVHVTVRQRTYERYESIVRVHLKPAFGRQKIKALSPNLVRGLYRQKLDGNLEQGVKPLSPRSVQYIHVTLHKSLKQAVSDGLIPRNVCSGIKAPRPGKPEITPFSREQARALLLAANSSGDRFAALYAVALHTGMREGELLGLRWDDVDLDATTPTLQVRRSLSETRTGYTFEKPKNGKGRQLSLSHGAVDALRAHRAVQNAERLQAGSKWHDNALVFPNTAGNPQSGPTLLKKSFRPLLQQAGLPAKFRIHDLRHTCATILLQARKHPKYVQELLGHANISITLDTYSHVIEGMDGGLGDAMDDALG
jgi:integrase